MPPLLPSLWHDDAPIPKSTITTGRIEIALDESVRQPLPGGAWEWVITPGDTAVVWNQFTTRGSGDNLALILTADLPPAISNDPVATTLELLDANGTPVATDSGDGTQALHACTPIPNTNNGAPLVWRVQVTSTDLGGLRWASGYELNRPHLKYPAVQLALTQARSGDGFTNTTDPCVGQQ